MSLFRSFSKLDQKFAWSFLGFVLAIIFGAISIYTAFFYERKPNLVVEVLSNTTVLDVHEKISNLSILYDNTDIIERQEALRVIIIRFLNNGNLDILKNYYDDDDPIGFTLSDGQIVQSPELLVGSNKYLLDNVETSLESSNTVLIKPVILEAGEYFSLKVLVLSPENLVPTITPVGKVAGVKEIVVTEIQSGEANLSFFTKTFVGDPLVQITRAIAYSIITLVVIIVLILLVSFFQEKTRNLKRRLLVRNFSKYAGISPEHKIY